MYRRFSLLTILIVAFATTSLFAAANDALGSAARAGDWDGVKALLAKGARGEQVNIPDSDGNRPLHWAIRVDEVEIAQLLIRAGADVRLANRLGVTPLYIAANNGNPVMVRLLLEAGANPNQTDTTGETILMTATRAGNAESVRALLDRGADPNVAEPQLQLTALILAAEAGDAEVVRALLDKKADVKARTRTGATPAPRLPCQPNQTGCGSHGEGIVRGGLPERGMRPPIPGAMTPLMYAAREGHTEAAGLLVDAGADVNEVDKNGIGPLLMAIGNNHIPTARYLIQRGANINAADAYGRTPLFEAVEIRNVDLHYVTFEHMVTEEDRKDALVFMKELLDRGVDPNIRVAEVPPLRRWLYLLGGSLAWVDFTGQTPFILASLSGDVSTMKLLLQYKADPKITTFAGTNALMAAAGVNWVVHQTYTEGEPALLDAVKLCYDLGMDVNATNSMGLTAMMGAANRGSDSIIEFLASKGAKLGVKDEIGRSAYNWAEGVFLATNAPEAKPHSMALIKKLMEASPK
jgi:ankyrin repeat protein